MNLLKKVKVHLKDTMVNVTKESSTFVLVALVG